MAVKYFKNGQWVYPNNDMAYVSGTTVGPISTTRASALLGLGRVFGANIYLHGPMTCDAVIVNVVLAAAAGGVGRVAIYGSDGTNKPSSLLFGSDPFDTTSAGDKTITISPAVELPAGLVFVCYVAQVATCTWAITNNALNPYVWDATPSGNNAGFNTGNNAVLGAFPSTPPAFTRTTQAGLAYLRAA